MRAIRFRRAVAATIAALALVGGVGVAGGVASASSSSSTVLGTSVTVGGSTQTAGTEVDHLRTINALACGAAGSCIVGGSFENTDDSVSAMLSTETSGSWSTPVSVPLPANALPFANGGGTFTQFATVTAAACSGSSCIIVGDYVDNSCNNQLYASTVTNGTPGPAVELSMAGLPGGGVASGPGSCTSVGNESLYSQAPQPDISAMAWLTSASCSAPGDCVAVGGITLSSAQTDSLALVETGGSWGAGIESTGTGNGDVVYQLTGVSCPAGSATCTLLGTSSYAGNQVFVQTLTGGSLSSLQRLLPASGTDGPGASSSISCTDAQDCTATGTTTLTSGAAANWTATETAGTWGAETVAATPSGTAGGPMICTDAADCTAIAVNATSGLLPLDFAAETSGTWASTAGSLPLPPNGTTNSSSSTYQAVPLLTCPTQASCVIASPYVDSAGLTQVFTYSEISPGNFPGSPAELAWPANDLGAPGPSVSLDAMACYPVSGYALCESVGEATVGMIQWPIVASQQTYGGPWQTFAAEVPAGAEANPRANLGGVACAPTTNNVDCVAVGSYVDTSADHQQAMANDSISGISVEITAPANAAANPHAELAGVSCSSAGDCTAVGSYADTSGNTQAMLAVETSGTWGQATELAAPSGAAANPAAQLTGVSCSTAADCTAVGSFETASGTVVPLVVSEVNGAWQAAQGLALPSGASNASLAAVSCTSAGSCVAVGSESGASGTVSPIAVSEVNGAWQAVQAVSAAADSEFSGVACLSAGNCTAAGTTNATPTTTLVASEVAGVWQAASSAPAAPGQMEDSSLLGIACSSLSGTCTAAGNTHIAPPSSWQDVNAEAASAAAPLVSTLVPPTSAPSTGSTGTPPPSGTTGTTGTPPPSSGGSPAPAPSSAPPPSSGGTPPVTTTTPPAPAPVTPTTPSPSSTPPPAPHVSTRGTPPPVPAHSLALSVSGAQVYGSLVTVSARPLPGTDAPAGAAVRFSIGHSACLAHLTRNGGSCRLRLPRTGAVTIIAHGTGAAAHLGYLPARLNLAVSPQPAVATAVVRPARPGQVAVTVTLRPLSKALPNGWRPRGGVRVLSNGVAVCGVQLNAASANDAAGTCTGPELAGPASYGAVELGGGDFTIVRQAVDAPLVRAPAHAVITHVTPAVVPTGGGRVTVTVSGLPHAGVCDLLRSSYAAGERQTLVAVEPCGTAFHAAIPRATNRSEFLLEVRPAAARSSTFVPAGVGEVSATELHVTRSAATAGRGQCVPLPLAAAGLQTSNALLASPPTFSAQGHLPRGIALSAGHCPGELLGASLRLSKTAAIGTHVFRVIVRDGEATAVSTVRVTVLAPLGIRPVALPTLHVGEQTRVQLRALGGDGPATFSLAGGSLPPGLRLTVRGLLVGTPRASGTSTAVIAATNRFGELTSRRFVLQVGS